jgi:hypothetical protein
MKFEKGGDGEGGMIALVKELEKEEQRKGLKKERQETAGGRGGGEIAIWG